MPVALRWTERHMRYCFPLLVVLGMVDRAVLLDRFGFRYTGDDDGVIGLAAHDYANGVFNEPYFYGQDYNPLLEAGIGALLLKFGVSHWVAMPLVSSLLALLPFWSFGLWHFLRKEHFMACLFAAVPPLLSVEYGMMTTITRGFVTGISMLAFCPWVLNIRAVHWRNACMGLVLSGAAFFNPNALIFCVAIGAVYLLGSDRKIPSSAVLLLGTAPFILAYAAARSYYLSRPETVVLSLYNWRMVFHAVGIPEGLGKAHLLFSWLFPVFWRAGELALYTLIALLAVLLWKRKWAMATGLCLSVLLILFSLGFAKTHDGEFNVFYPAARMFLAMPLLLAWALSGIVPGRGSWHRLVPLLITVSIGSVCIKTFRTEAIVIDQVSHLTGQVSELPRAYLLQDKARLIALCEAYQVDAVVATDRRDPVENGYRCYLYGAIDERMPPTYLYAMDRRYWQRAALAGTVVPDILIVGGNPSTWRRRMGEDGRIIDASDSTFGQMHIITGNGEPTDSLISRLFTTR